MSNFLHDEVMRVLQGHKGQANAMLRKDLLAHLQLFRPKLDDRGMREIYSSLPVCSGRDGLYLPVSTAEVLEFKAYITKAWGPIVAHRRCATIYAFNPKLIPPAEQLGLPMEGAGA